MIQENRIKNNWPVNSDLRTNVSPTYISIYFELIYELIQAKHTYVYTY